VPDVVTPEIWQRLLAPYAPGLPASRHVRRRESAHSSERRPFEWFARRDLNAPCVVDGSCRHFGEHGHVGFGLGGGGGVR
jgi:hypothetical protein